MLTLRWHGHRADVTALARSTLIVIRDAVIRGRTICLCFLLFLSSRDDHGTSIAADVDDIAEVTVGVVEGIATNRGNQATAGESN